MELGPEGRLLPEMLGEELWRAASAEMVELSKAEFAEALETIGAKGLRTNKCAVCGQTIPTEIAAFLA